MNFSANETRWIKFGKLHDFVFVGKETIATASGIHVSFLDLNTRNRRIERFDNKERGDGASCLAGHSVTPMFSVVERKPNPKISVFAYPALRRISRCAFPDKVNGYLSCCFAGTEYLVSLTTFPDFRLIVWLWRTGEHVAALDTKIDSLVQEICCSVNSPHLISQLDVTDGAFAVYQVRTCSKIVSVHLMSVPLPTCRVVCSSWTPEGNLFVSDEFGNVWLVTMDANQLCPIIKSETHESPNSTPPIVVAHESGVIVADANNEITLYKKSSTNWNASWQFVWSISTFHTIQAAKRHHHRDGILFHSRSGEIFQITTQRDHVPHIQVICTDEIEYKALLSVSQRADHIAAVDRLDRLCIFELSTGKFVTRVSLRHHGEVLRTVSHPVLPMFASCSATGNCIFVDITNASSPRTFNCFHLHRELLDRIKFSLRGEFLAVGNSQTGNIFVIEKQRGERHEIDVLGLVKVGGHITDFLIYERSGDRFEMLVLATANPSMPSIGGDKMIVYNCEISAEFCARAAHVIDLLCPYGSLSHYGKSDEPLGILCVPSLHKQLHQMEIQNDFQDIELTQALHAMHQMRSIGIFVTACRVLTYGYDGLIVIRDGSDICEVVALFMPHHRSEGGIKCAVSSRLGEMVVSLGRNGDLVASRVRLPQVGRASLPPSTATASEYSIKHFASSCSNEGSLKEETWLDGAIAAELKAERDRALPVRAAIMADLETIKTQICQLLDVNEARPPDARLPISAFDLDRNSRQRRIEEAHLEQEQMRCNIEEECAQRDQASSYLREMFWELLLIKPCALRSIARGADTIVRNFPLAPPIDRKMAHDPRVWDRLSAEADEFLYSYDVYNKSVDEESDAGRESVTIVSNEEPSTASSNKTHEAAKRWYTLADEDEKLCISGTTTHKWIQDEGVAPMHQLLAPRDDLEAILRQDAIIENRERKLKTHFNDLFEEMRRAKGHELERAKERIDRLRYCASQLKMIFGIDSCLEPIDVPTWNVDEIPDHVVTMQDREVSEKRPQEASETVDTIVQDQDTKAKDFYTEALDGMMDGVLEPRWEDEVKKEVPVPECLTAKDPASYTNEDVAVIALYKCRVQALQEEREKYKATLQTEIAETKEALQEDIAAFDDKLRELELKRLQIESAILQERLMRTRAIRAYRTEQAGRQRIERFTDEELAPATRQVRRLADEYGSHEAAASELRARYDGLCKAERRQEARFRGEFAQLKQPMVEYLLRHYKKRPKVGRLTTTSVTYLMEVARCVTSDDRQSDILPRDCLDFLGGMDALDAMPGNLPAQINAAHWQAMCKLRRAKVELETKVRCCAIEMAEAEQTLSFYQKSMQAADSAVASKKLDLDNMEKSLAQLAREMEVQLVLKMGQIEVTPLRGDPTDYADAVLVTRDELLRVNNDIIEAGKCKLAAMRESMRLRKLAAQQEWQHACEKMLLDDFQQDLKDVREFKITRHVLEFLKRYPYSSNLEENYGKKQANLRMLRNRLREMLDAEHARLRETKLLMAKWRKKNDKITRQIELKSADVEERRQLLNDPCRKREEASRRMRLAAIARRTRLVMKLENNYEQLLTLHARLEVLKLRTYPNLAV